MKSTTVCDDKSKRHLEQQIVASDNAISKIQIVIDAVQNCGREILLGYLNEWYRKGVLDFLSCLSCVSEQELHKDIFFRAFGVFRNYIDICIRQDVGSVVCVAEKCYKIAGQDLTNVLALEKIETYLDRYPEDIDEAIRYCEHVAPYGKGSPFVWMAALKRDGKSYCRKFISWINVANNDDEIAVVLHALALVPEKVGDASKFTSDVVAWLIKVNERCRNDEIRGALYNTCEVWRKVVSRQQSTMLAKIASELVTDGCPTVLYCATRNAWLSAQQQSEKNVDDWLSVFVKIDPKYKGIVENLSYYLQALLDVCPEKVFIFIENYSRAHSCSVTVFDNIIGAIANSDEVLRNTYFTRWLASDSIFVARNVYEIVSHVRLETTLHINVVSAQPAKYTDEELLLLFLRAIGWLYLMPETCIGFLISCAQQMHEESLKSVHDDFFYLVVLSYVDEYVQALKQVPKGDERQPYYKYLKKLKSDALRWWKRLKAAGECLELSPSIRHKELYAKHRSDVYGKAMKEARDNSILSHIAHNICLLHGRGWIVPVHTKDGETMEDSLLKRFSASIRVSRLSEIEEHTLETRLAELRRVKWEERA